MQKHLASLEFFIIIILLNIIYITIIVIINIIIIIVMTIIIPAFKTCLIVIMQDPEMQKMLYAQMPEHLRSPEALKLMMQDPELEDMLKQNLQELDDVSACAMFLISSA